MPSPPPMPPRPTTPSPLTLNNHRSDVRLQRHGNSCLFCFLRAIGNRPFGRHGVHRMSEPKPPSTLARPFRDTRKKKRRRIEPEGRNSRRDRAYSSQTNSAAQHKKIKKICHKSPHTESSLHTVSFRSRSHDVLPQGDLRWMRAPCGALWPSAPGTQWH